MTLSESTFPWTVLTLGLAILLLEASLLGLYHEEPTRTLVAVSMVENGRWFVPDLLGTLYLKKPPGYNWFIALVSLPFGRVSPLLARTPAILSWLSLGYLVGNLASDFTDRCRFHWLAACAIWFNLTVFLEKAALAEIDLFFSLVLFGAFWLFYRFERLGQEGVGLIVSQLLLALAVLTKGPVAYLFFYLPIGLYAFWRDDSFSWQAFLAGFLVAHVIVLGWFWRVMSEVSLDTYLHLLVEEVFERGVTSSPLAYLMGLPKYPAMLFGAFLPWSPFLLAFLWRNWRRRILNSVDSLTTLTLFALVPFFVLWFIPVNKVRYALPLFPWLAILVGLIFARIGLEERFITFSRIIGLFLAGLLILVYLVPYQLDSSGVVSSAQQILVGSLIGTVGVFCFLVAVRTESVTHLLATMLVFVLSMKTGYLALFLPAEEPQVFRNEAIVRAEASDLRSRGYRSLLYLSEDTLEVPYYFYREGFRVKIRNTRGDEPSPDLVVEPDAKRGPSTVTRINLLSAPSFTVSVNRSRQQGDTP